MITEAIQERETYLNASYGIKSWLLTKDHKRIALLYLHTITFFFFLGGIFATLIRLELLTPKGTLVSADTYSKLFTLHGIIMGRKKFPSVAGMEGIRKKKIMITPCSVNSLL